MNIEEQLTGYPPGQQRVIDDYKRRYPGVSVKRIGPESVEAILVKGFETATEARNVLAATRVLPTGKETDPAPWLEDES